MIVPAIDQVILVDDDADLLEATKQSLEIGGWRVRAYSSAAKALAALESDFAGVVMSDIRMPHMDGRQFFERIQSVDPEIPVVFITGHGDIAQAVEALQGGAHDFVEKPFDIDRLLQTLAAAGDRRRRTLETRGLKLAADEAQSDWPLIGQSPDMRALRARLRQIAEAEIDTMIEGETGVGKELAARALHSWSRRKDRPFVVINCGALPIALAESELFGHELGAFPGAMRQRIGRIESANRGVLLLDEIEAMPLELQVKLLRFLEEREITPLGSNETRSLDIRVIASTKLSPEEALSSGQLRPDLFHRLNVVRVRIPALREHRSDVPALFAHFAARAASRIGQPMPQLTEEVRRALSGHDWPGNVRELANFAERFALGLETPADMEPGDGATDGLRERVERYEVDLVREALTAFNGDVPRSIEALQIPRKTFYDKVRRYGIDLGEFRKG